MEKKKENGWGVALRMTIYAECIQKKSVNKFWTNQKNLNNLVYILFTNHSRKSIFTQHKSIKPLSSSLAGCYNTHTSRRGRRHKPCKLWTIKFHLRRRPHHFSGGIAMKKNSVKQLLVNAMKEYGEHLILSERFWSYKFQAPTRAAELDRINICAWWSRISNLEVCIMKNIVMKNLVKSMAQYGEMLTKIGA